MVTLLVSCTQFLVSCTQFKGFLKMQPDTYTVSVHAAPHAAPARKRPQYRKEPSVVIGDRWE